MQKLLSILLLVVAAVLMAAPASGQDPRQKVELPPMMQEHMLANMRDHLRAIDEILGALAEGRGQDAAQIAEKRLGMTSLNLHGADHMGRFMPAEMRELGTRMHRAASRFALTAQTAEFDVPETYAALRQVTSTCVACHDAYRLH